MGQSAGAGSDVWFACWKCRRRARRAWRRRGPRSIRLTGKTRPYHPPRGSALGVRSDRTSREYKCLTCGHVGWSNHIDLKQMEPKTDES